MPTIEEKLDNFNRLILEDATRSRDEILAQLKAEAERKLAESKADIDREAAALVTRETSRADRDCDSSVSRASIDARKRLMGARNDIIADVLAGLSRMLRAFAGTDEYGPFLEANVREAVARVREASAPRPQAGQAAGAGGLAAGGGQAVGIGQTVGLAPGRGAGIGAASGTAVRAGALPGAAGGGGGAGPGAGGAGLGEGGAGEVVVWLTPQDFERYAGRLGKALPGAEFLLGDEGMIGGCRAANRSRGVYADNTLEKRVELCTDELFAISGLRITR